MEREEIRQLLTQLGSRLHARGIQGEMYIVGGAAMALAFDFRRSTRDIDAIFEPKTAIYEEAAAMARDFSLPPGWLNDGVKGFLGPEDPEAAPILEAPGLRCLTASPKMLLALKVLAHRVGEDENDVLLLADLLELSNATQVLEVASSVFGDRLDAAAQFFVEELFQSRN